MQIQGSHLIRAARARVWQLLNDPAVLARCAPGVSDLHATGPDQFAGTFAVALGPVKGNFKAEITLLDKVPDEALSLTLSARGPVGTIGAKAHLGLADEDGATRVTWTGEPQLMGMLAAVGGRFAQTAAQSHADAFFSRLEDEARGNTIAP